MQYLGLGLGSSPGPVLLQPLIWVVMISSATGRGGRDLRANGAITPLSGTAMPIIFQAVVITLAIFIGLTLTVFLTKKDFSFLRGILSICTFAALGVILASLAVRLHLGACSAAR